MRRFKKGAFALSLKSGLPIIPIASYGGIDMIPKGRLTLNPGRIYLSIQEPIYPEKYYDGNQMHTSQSLDDLLYDTHARISRGIKELMSEYR